VRATFVPLGQRHGRRLHQPHVGEQVCISLSLSLSLCVLLSIYLCIYMSLCTYLSLALCLSLSLSQNNTNKMIIFVCLSIFFHSPYHCLSLSLSLSHAHTQKSALHNNATIYQGHTQQTFGIARHRKERKCQAIVLRGKYVLLLLLLYESHLFFSSYHVNASFNMYVELLQRHIISIVLFLSLSLSLSRSLSLSLSLRVYIYICVCVCVCVCVFQRV